LYGSAAVAYGDVEGILQIDTVFIMVHTSCPVVHFAAPVFRINDASMIDLSKARLWAIT
jgi:hypothetical protein